MSCPSSDCQDVLAQWSRPPYPTPTAAWPGLESSSDLVVRAKPFLSLRQVRGTPLLALCAPTLSMCLLHPLSTPPHPSLQQQSLRQKKSRVHSLLASGPLAPHTFPSILWLLHQGPHVQPSPCPPGLQHSRGTDVLCFQLSRTRKGSTCGGTVEVFQKSGQFGEG